MAAFFKFGNFASAIFLSDARCSENLPLRAMLKQSLFAYQT